MFNLNKYSKEEKRQFVIITSIFVISIIVGYLVGQNREWFRPSFSHAGYMAGSLITCLLLFSLYRFISFISSFLKKTAE